MTFRIKLKENFMSDQQKIMFAIYIFGLPLTMIVTKAISGDMEKSILSGIVFAILYMIYHII